MPPASCTALPSDTRRRRTLAFLRTFVREVDQDRVLGLAAETAFFAVLSLFPALLVAVSLLGLLDVLVGAGVAAQAQDRVVDTLSLVLTDAASDAVRAVESLFEEARGGLLTLATGSALVSLSGAFAVAVNALNLAYDASESRSWWRRRLLGLGLAAGSLVLLVVALGVFVVGPLFGRGEQLADLVGLGPVFTFVWDVLRLPVLAAAGVLWLAAMLRLAPARRPRWRHVLPGALLAGALCLVASAGLRVYLSFAAGANPVLGAFGGGAVVMLWLYLLSLSLLLGGELNGVLADRRHLHDDARDVPGDDVEQLPLFR